MKKSIYILLVGIFLGMVIGPVSAQYLTQDDTGFGSGIMPASSSEKTPPKMVVPTPPANDIAGGKYASYDDFVADNEKVNATIGMSVNPENPPENAFEVVLDGIFDGTIAPQITCEIKNNLIAIMTDLEIPTIGPYYFPIVPAHDFEDRYTAAYALEIIMVSEFAAIRGESFSDVMSAISSVPDDARIQQVDDIVSRMQNPPDIRISEDGKLILPEQGPVPNGFFDGTIELAVIQDVVHELTNDILQDTARSSLHSQRALMLIFSRAEPAQ